MHIAGTFSSAGRYQGSTRTEAKERSTAFLVYLLSLFVLLLGCAIFYIWSRIQIVNVGYEINRHLKERDFLTEENKKIQLEIATLKSPVRLETLAKKEFNMDLPRQDQIFTARTQSKPANPSPKALSKPSNEVDSHLSKTVQTKAESKKSAQNSSVKPAQKVVPLSSSKTQNSKKKAAEKPGVSGKKQPSAPSTKTAKTKPKPSQTKTTAKR